MGVVADSDAIPTDTTPDSPFRQLPEPFAHSTMSALKEQPRAWAVCTFVALLGFLTGWDVGYIGSMLESDSFIQDVNHGKPLSGFEAGTLVGLTPLFGALIALPCVCGVLMDRVGRRGLIVLCGLTCLVSASVQATSRSLEQLYVGRILLGFDFGCACVCPVYQSEVAPKEARGAMMGMFSAALYFGIFIATVCNYMFLNISHGWTLCIWPMAFISVILMTGMLYCPETPRCLLSNGNETKALEVLTWLRAGAPEECIRQEWAIMQNEVVVQRQGGNGSCKLLMSGFMGRLLRLAVVGWLLFQLCGMPVFSYFGPKMFKMIRIDAFAFQMITTGLPVVIMVPTLWIVDRFGRKPLLKYGSVAMAVSMLSLGVVGSICIVIPLDCPGKDDPTECAHSVGRKDGEVDVAIQAAMMFFSLGFVSAYSMSWGAVMNVFGNEIFPLEHRAKAVAIGTSAAAVGNYLLGQITPVLMDSIGFRTFIIFSVADVLCFCYACWIPETANVQLEQIVTLFEDRFGVKYNAEEADSTASGSGSSC